MEKLGLNITEQEYRNLPLPSYSLFSDIQKVNETFTEEEANKIYKNIDVFSKNKVTLGTGVIAGTIIDQIITEGVYNNKYIKVIDKIPSGKMLDIINEYIANKEFLHDSESVLSKLNEPIIDVLCEKHKYKKSKSQRIAGFMNYSDYIFFRAKDPKNMIISKYEFNQSTKAANILLNTFPFLNKQYAEDNNLEVHYQSKFVFELDEALIKCMLDVLLINHSKKIIVPIDIKSGSTNASAFRNKCFLGWNYYIQSYLYKEAVKYYIINYKPELIDYEILDFSFLYINRFHYDTIRFDVDKNLHHTSYLSGFEYDTKNIEKGIINKLSVKKLIELYKANSPKSYNEFLIKNDIKNLYGINSEQK